MDFISATYEHEQVHMVEDAFEVRKTQFFMKTRTRIQRTGVLIVGLGGKLGATTLATHLANKLGVSWSTRKCQNQQASWAGSITQCSKVDIGDDISIPFNKMVPMLNPNDLIIDGWDINKRNMYDALVAAGTLEPTLLEKLEPHLRRIEPMASVVSEASIHKDNLNLIKCKQHRASQLECLRQQIRDFKALFQLESVVVMWCAGDEKGGTIKNGVHDTATNLLRAIGQNSSDVSTSMLFAVASLMEKSTFINCTSQNTLIPGILDLASENGSMVAGNDLIGKKQGVLYQKSCLGDVNQIIVHDLFDDTILKVPVMIDLVILAELMQRVTIKSERSPDRADLDISEARAQHQPILWMLSSMFNNPLGNFKKNENTLGNFVRALRGLPPNSFLTLH